MNEPQIPAVTVLELLPTRPEHYAVTRLGHHAGEAVLIRTQGSNPFLAHMWQATFTLHGDPDTDPIEVEKQFHSLRQLQQFLGNYQPPEPTHRLITNGPDLTLQYAWRPADGTFPKAEIHFGYVPTGKKLLCHLTRTQSTWVTENTRWLTCTSCRKEAVNAGTQALEVFAHRHHAI